MSEAIDTLTADLFSADAADVPAVPTIADLIERATDPARDELAAARAVVAKVIEAAKDDPTAHLDPSAMSAFKLVRERDPLKYEIARTRMKQANKLVRVETLDDFTKSDNSGAQVHESAATVLTALASELCELWHDPDGNAFASFEREHDGGVHREHWRVESTGFKDWLAWLGHTRLGAAPSSETVKSACNAISGKAKFDGAEHTPALRVAKTGAGYWLDMCDDQWRAIHTTTTGWAIVEKPPVRFVRNKAMRSMIVPSTDGNVDLLWALVNVPEEDRPLVLAWILESLRPDTPYPVLELIGEQGSAKSTTQETIRLFLDPNKVMLRGRPKGVEDVFVAAGANHVISLENLSGITPELSDALCTISTGGGQAGRLFFTNGEEHIIEAHNPVMLNGIGAVVTRPDLLDRTIAVCLPVIGERITEAEHAVAVDRSASSVMAGLLDLFAQTLAGLDDVHIDPKDRPRMADFAHLGEAMHRVMGGTPGAWLAMYLGHRRDAIRRTIDSSPVAQACIELVESGGRYSGTVKGLLELFNTRNADSSIERGDYWPRSPKGLGDALRRAAPALRQIGIHLSVDTKPRRDGMHCQLRAGGESFPGESVHREPSSPSSQPSQQREVVTV